jgi:phenylacetate-CoA ligase
MPMTPLPLGNALKSLVADLENSQWLPASSLDAMQRRHLGQLAAHCARHSPFFARRLRGAGIDAATLAEAGGLQRLLPMTRRALQAAGEDLYCREIPPGHGNITETQTSGSTGEPVTVRRTSVNGLFWNGMVMRELRWHQRDVMGRLCSINPTIDVPARYDSWGPPASVFGRTGPTLTLPITASVAELASQAAEFQPTFLITLPTTLDAFALYCQAHGVHLPHLRHVLTISETLSPSTRELTETVFGASVADVYSSEECNQIAMSCPESGHYHVAAENVIAEVVDVQDRPCEPGAVGRVLVTCLHNYATPLIRYELGDYVEVAPPCPCGRGLPAWRRILGRERNLVVMPDGSRVWPVLGFRSARDVAPVVQFQFVQHTREVIEARLVTERPLTAAEEDRLRSLFAKAIGHPFVVRFTYVSGQLHKPGHKFEEFVSHVAADGDRATHPAI